jgi:hypothetical protein
MFFIRIAGLVTGILLVAAFALLPDQDRVADYLRALYERFAATPSIRAHSAHAISAHDLGSTAPAAQLTPDPGLDAREQQHPDNATDAAAEGGLTDHAAAAPPGRRHCIWKPFNTRSQAEGFARSVSALCGAACDVEKQPDGYRIYSTYHADDERDRVIACMEARAGVRLADGPADRGFAD